LAYFDGDLKAEGAGVRRCAARKPRAADPGGAGTGVVRRGPRRTASTACNCSAYELDPDYLIYAGDFDPNWALPTPDADAAITRDDIKVPGAVGWQGRSRAPRRRKSRHAA